MPRAPDPDWRAEPEPAAARLEFFGLPGSGKTTLARACWDRLAREEDPAPAFAPRLTRDEWSGLRRSLARLDLILRALPGAPAERRAARLIATLPQPRPRDRAKVLFNALTVAALYRRLQASPGGFVVDQGILQAIWSAYLRAPVPFAAESWRSVLAAEATPGRTYVCVATPIATCVQRLARRPEQRARMQSPALLRDDRLWERAERLRQALVATLAESGQPRDAPPRIILADGTRDPKAAADRILALLRPRRRPARA